MGYECCCAISSSSMFLEEISKHTVITIQFVTLYFILNTVKFHHQLNCKFISIKCFICHLKNHKQNILSLTERKSMLHKIGLMPHNVEKKYLQPKYSWSLS